MPFNWSTVSAADIPRFFNRIYAIHHARRFEWLKSKIACLGKSDISVLELGCNDARSIEYIPVPIKRYLGLDAGAADGKMARPTASSPLRFASGTTHTSSFAAPSAMKTSSACRGNSMSLSFSKRSNI